MRHLDLFSGIGGFALAASWVWREEYETIAFVEREKYCQRVLRKNFPGVPICEDIYAAKGEDYTPVDLLTGGFPCQPFSVAGKQRGKEDDRYLWPEMLRVIREVRPRWVIGENVAGIINMELDQVLTDLEDEGYTCWTFIIPACAIGSRHIRDRVWILANSDKEGLSKFKRQKKKLARSGLDRCFMPDNWREWNPYSAFILRGDDGIPGRVGGVKGFGNAIVPQVAAAIMQVIKDLS